MLGEYGMYYFPHNVLNGRAQRDAEIVKFKTYEEMEEYASSLSDDVACHIIETQWGEAWIKPAEKPKVADEMVRPFSFNQMSILNPGSHPGGHCYWVTPKTNIYTVSWPDDDFDEQHCAQMWG